MTMTMKPHDFVDCEDCKGTGRIQRAECYLCGGTGHYRMDADAYEDAVADKILSASDEDILSGQMNGLADGTHFIDRYGIIRPKG
jgi:RecJ-like exonuclease